jgi:hypothetical protein
MNDQFPSLSRYLAHVVVVIGLLVTISFVWFLWPKQTTSEPVEQQPTPVEQVVPVEQPTEEPEIVEPEPEPERVVTLPELEPKQPKPLDTSDGTIKTLLLELAEYETLARLLVDDDLLRRFVVLVDNLSRSQMAANHRLFHPLKQPFKVYHQAGSDWVDNASYQRYNLYVDMFEDMDAAALMKLYRQYKPAINEIYAELAIEDGDFDLVLIEAVDNLLDTPEVPVPVPVYTESVMYKFQNEELENLPPSQKQLLRLGPDNIRRVKAKLIDIKHQLNMP